MQRIACDERPDWRAKAEEAGFRFHTIDGERYWDERAYYAFTLKEIEEDIEAPTAELDAMCRELVARAVEDERMLKVLRIPERFWTFIAASWKRGDRSLYGRFDLSYSGEGPAKLLEYNADTPTSVFETAVFQWMWLEDAKARAITPQDADQYNSLHERLIEGWREIGKGGHVHLAGAIDDPEDGGTIAYMEDTARQAGLATTVMPMDQIGRTPKGAFVDLADKPIALMFKLYPWEWMFREQFGASLAGAPTRWLEPPWKAILSNKGILPLLWAMIPRHPNLLAAYFDEDAKAAELGDSFVRKPLYSREGSNVTIMVAGQAIDQDQGPYGAEGFVRQAVATLPRYQENYAAIGSWIAAAKPCGLSVREDASPITKNTSRFLPHAIVG
ncbi:MAG: glutathionylspermidine synthase family protein [Alphaproteobacteria bacterium]|nr:MAG: glutathionylspermidine synthase family protein [Alphaproteobacteria bacterium]